MDYQIALDGIVPRLRPDLDVYRDALVVVRALFETRPVVASAYNRVIVEKAKEHAAVMAAEGRYDDTDKLLATIESLLDVDCRVDFDHYMQRMEWRRSPEKRFFQPRREVFLPVVHDLQDLYDGKLDFYSLSLPPRTGKSTIGCFFMSFNMGAHPTDAHIMTGFSDKLTYSFWGEMLSIVSDSDEYMFAELFPDAPLKDKNAANETISLAKKRRFPTLTCRSIGGTLTGAVEVGQKGILYCDDMVEDYEQALNADRMDKLYEAYLSQARDRKLDGAREFHIGTRWVPNDPIGRIEQEFAGNPRYRFRRIPALNAAGSQFHLPIRAWLLDGLLRGHAPPAGQRRCRRQLVRQVHVHAVLARGQALRARRFALVRGAARGRAGHRDGRLRHQDARPGLLRAGSGPRVWR